VLLVYIVKIKEKKKQRGVVFVGIFEKKKKKEKKGKKGKKREKKTQRKKTKIMQK